MKNTIKGIILGAIIGGGLVFGFNKIQPQETVKKVQIDKICTESTEDVYVEPGEYYVELTDGSWLLVNEEKNYYLFQPSVLGDWDYELENIQQLENIVKTYINIQNTGSY